MKNKLTTSLLILAALLQAGRSNAQLVSDDFTDGDRTNNPAWYVNQGAFTVNFNEADNIGSSQQQIFTTSFAETDLADGDTLRLTMSYRPDGSNLTAIRFGLFDGVAPAADSWNQFTAGQPTRDWRGYFALLGVSNGVPSDIRRNDNIVDDHPFFIASVTNGVGAGTNVAGSLTFRSIRLDMVRSGSTMLFEFWEGASPTSLVSMVTGTDTNAFFDGFNNLAFFQTTGGGNGHVRYDNILLELISAGPEGPLLGIDGLTGNEITLLLSDLSIGASCVILKGPTPETGSAFTSFTVTNSIATLAVQATNLNELIWAREDSTP